MSVVSRIFTKLIGEVSNINGNTKSALLRVNGIDLATAQQIITVTSLSGYMQPCTGGTIDDYMGVGITLSNPVSVTTTFFVDVFYAQSGTNCGGGQLSQSFAVEVLAGNFNGEVDACTGGQFFSNGATICSTCVNDYNGNTVDTINLSSFSCAPLSITFSSFRTRTLTNSTDSTSGTFTITGGSYALFAQAISQANSTVTVLTTINGVTKNANIASTGTSNSTQIILGPGTYPYTFDIDVNSGTGSGGIVSIPV
jgi:hypothetical protein